MSHPIDYRRITPQEFERLHDDVAYAETYFGIGLDADDNEVMSAYFDALERSDRYLDLDKKCQDIHFLITGKSLNTNEIDSDILWKKLFTGGAETALDPLTFGIVNYLTVNEVREISAALNNSSTDDLQVHLNAFFESSENMSYMESLLLSLHSRLVQFFNAAAQQEDMILISVWV